MNRSSLALTIFLLVPTAAYGQSVARAKQPCQAESLSSQTKTATQNSDPILAERAVVALKRLDRDVLTFRSLGDFEADGRLACVPLETFQDDLQEIAAEVGPLLSRLPQSKLKTEIRNALDSYRDGAFWWEKIHQPRVLNVSSHVNTERTSTASDIAFSATIPYTVAIHWRQANKCLKRVEDMVTRSRK